MATPQKADDKDAEKAQPEATPQKADETVPGGRYLVGGTLVDANGNPVEG